MIRTFTSAPVNTGKERSAGANATAFPLVAVKTNVPGTVLDHVDAADRPQITYSKVLADLIPVPIQPVMDTTGETLAAATAAWIDPEALRTDILRWLPLVRGNADALDALIMLARTATTR